MNRVYEIARKLGLRDRDVHRAIGELGYPVRSAATPVTDEELPALLEKLRGMSAASIEADRSDGE